MMCPKTEAVYLERQAASARPAATLQANRREAIKVQKRAALCPDCDRISMRYCQPPGISLKGRSRGVACRIRDFRKGSLVWCVSQK